VALACLPFIAAIVPPMADLPAHVLVARIVAAYSDAGLQFSDYFTVEWAAAPTALFYLLLVPLQKIVGPFADTRIYLTVWVALTWWSAICLARALRRRDPWLAGLVSLPLAFCWYAYNGFLPFLMSLPLFALSVAVWYGNWKAPVRTLVLALLLLALFGFHIVGAAAAAAVICTGELVRVWQDKRRLRDALWSGAAVAPLAIVTLMYLLGRQSPTSRLGYRPLLEQVVDVVKFTCATLDDSAGILMLAWLVAVALAAVVRWRRLAAEPALVAGATLLLVLSAALPSSLGALWPAGPRLLPFVLLLVVAAVPWAEFRRSTVVAASVVLLCGLSLFTTRKALELGNDYRDLLGGLEMVEPGKRALPIITDVNLGSRWTKPFLHVGAIQTILRGGTNPYVFATPHILTGASPLAYRHDEDARAYAFIYDDDHAATDYRGVAAHYDYVLLWGAAPAIADVLDAEMSQVYSRGHVMLFARRDSAQGRVTWPLR
jgi:hypothetical protein